MNKLSVLTVVFGNKYYKIKIIVLIFIIFLACIYSQKKYCSEITLQECLLNPERLDMATLTFGNNTKVGKVQKDRFELLNGINKIAVIGSVEGLKTNDYIELISIFHKEGYLELKEIYVRKLRRIKVGVSVVPVLLIAWLVLKQYKFDFEKRVILER